MADGIAEGADRGLHHPTTHYAGTGPGSTVSVARYSESSFQSRSARGGPRISFMRIACWMATGERSRALNQAFDVTPGQGLYLAPDQRVRMW